MVEPASAPQRRGLDEAYLQFIGYPDLGSLNRVKLIIEQVAIYAQKKQLERLRIPDIGYSLQEILVNRLGIGRMMIPLTGRSGRLKKLCDFFGVAINVDYFAHPYQRYLQYKRYMVRSLLSCLG